ncbi:MAG: hypothetical protein LQ349_009212, partial [Xanthoria aureola]
KPGQGGDADVQPRDLRAQLLEAEAAHFSKSDGTATKPATIADSTTPSKRRLEAGPGQDADGEEDIDAKRRRVLEETRHLDADSDESSNASSEEDRDSSDDDEDETAELLRELEKIKKERAEKQAQEDREKVKAEQEDRERDIALGNPLLNPHKSTESKRRWDDDVVFRNQARGTENKGKREFVNSRIKTVTAWFHRSSYTSTPPQHRPDMCAPYNDRAASVEVPEVGFGKTIIQKRYQPCDLLVYYRFPCYSRSSYTSVDEYSSTTSLNAMQYWTGQQCLDDLRLRTTAIDFEAVSYSIVIIQLPRFSWSSSIRYAFVSQP